MNNRQLEAARHAKELALAKSLLIKRVNQQIQIAKGVGFKTELAPQLIRLLGLKAYRARELNRINDLIADSDKLTEYISVIDPLTDEVIYGGQAQARYKAYSESGIYHKSEFEYIPAQSDIMIQNFIEEAEKAFVDDTVYQEFIAVLNALLNGDTTIVPDEMWQMLHPRIYNTANGSARSDKSIKHSHQYFLSDVNMHNITDIESAVTRLVELEGSEELIKRLADAGENIINLLIVAGVGYREQAAGAAQEVLKVLLPKTIRDRALSMDYLADRVDDFNGEIIE
nr:MAG TPA: hypothetical protein [Caudoviricetes sp.]